MPPSCRFISGRSLECLRGSITAEAALLLPLFLFFCIQLISIISLIQLHSVLEAALHQEVSEAALRMYVYSELGMSTDSSISGLLEDFYLREKVIERAGEEYLDSSMIEGGSDGVRIVYAEASDGQDSVDVTLSYQVKPVADILGFSGFTMANRCRMKAWTGYQVESGGTASDETEELVYITEAGTVYHKSKNCSYLQLSIREVEADSLSVLRNDSGGKYYPCESCGGGSGGTVFITDQGNRYHTSLSCSGLKRTIYTVPISEVGGRGPCSRCGGM